MSWVTVDHKTESKARCAKNGESIQTLCHLTVASTSQLAFDLSDLGDLAP